MDEPRTEDRDVEFERGLERLFQQPPHVEDADAFAAKVQARLARSWRLRTFGIGAAGVLGGGVAASQVLGSGLIVHAAQASTRSAQAADAWYRGLFSNLDALSHVTPSTGLFWAVSGLMILAAVIGATRVLDEV